MIKPENLAIGDYVSMKKTGEHAKVFSITEDVIGCVLNSDEASIVYSKPTGIEPIELTTDVESKYGLRNIDSYRSVTITYTEKNRSSNSNDIECYRNKLTIIRYLHDLQHFLRLIGEDGIKPLHNTCGKPKLI